MKKIIIIDWLDKYGGAERVIKSMHEVLNFDEAYTLVNIMKNKDLKSIFPNQGFNINTTFLQKFGIKFRYFFLCFWSKINSIKIDENTDLIISSSHAVSKGINKSNPSQIHISYFQAPNSNFIWDEAPLYFGRLYPVAKHFLGYLRKLDVKQSKNPDYIIANSKFVQNWVKEKYNRESTVIYPPINLSKFSLMTKKQDYYVAVGRIVQIKRFDIIIEAFNANKKKLIIIGSGDLLDKLKKTANNNIEFKGFLDTEEINEIIGNAKGFIQAGIEGFGIAPLEAQACGTPVIAFRKGGSIEVVVEGETGVFFDNQNAISLNNALEVFEKQSFDPLHISKHAHQFTEERFKKEFLDFVNEKCSKRI